MKEKIVDGILVRQVRKNLWVSYCGNVWMENVQLPSKSRTLYTNRWHRTNANTRVKINDELRYRLVAEAWVYNPKPGIYTIINHLDGCPTNDHADNLEWCDVSRNTQHAYDLGLNTSKKQTNENLRMLTDGEEQEIHQRYLVSKAKNRLDEVSREYNISRSLLKKINKKWRK